tara:strand:+ start:516 stop:728 length:213 start_codon:yes stop_codon:yes gene_type:complete
MAETKPDALEEVTVPPVTELADIESLDDVKEVFNDGIDKLKEMGVDDIKKTALRAGNRIFAAWRKLVDGD